MLPIGTLINVGTVVFGTLQGTSVGNRLPERLRETALVAIGLITLVLGLQMGLQTHNILMTLGCLAVGGIAAVALASSLIWGGGLAAGTVFVFQGTISLDILLAGSTMLVEMTAVGAFVIMGLGLILLDLKRIRIANFLTSLAFAPILVLLVHWVGIPVAP